MAPLFVSFDGSLGPVTYGENEGENISSVISPQYSGFVQDGVCSGSESARVLPRAKSAFLFSKYSRDLRFLGLASSTFFNESLFS